MASQITPTTDIIKGGLVGRTSDDLSSIWYTDNDTILADTERDAASGKLDLVNNEDDITYYKEIKARYDQEERDRIQRMSNEERRVYYNSIYSPDKAAHFEYTDPKSIEKMIVNNTHDLGYLDSLEKRVREHGVVNMLNKKYPRILTADEANAQAKELGVQIPPIAGNQITEGKLKYQINEALYRQSLEQEIARYKEGRDFTVLQNLNFFRAAVSGNVGAAELAATIVAGLILAPAEAALGVRLLGAAGQLAKGTRVGAFAKTALIGARYYNRQKNVTRSINLLRKEAKTSQEALQKLKRLTELNAKRLTTVKNKGFATKLGYDMAKLDSGVTLGMSPSTAALTLGIDGVMGEIPAAAADEWLRANAGEATSTSRVMQRLILAGVGGSVVGLGANAIAGLTRGSALLLTKAKTSWVSKEIDKRVAREAKTGIKENTNVLDEVGAQLETTTKYSPIEIDRIQQAEFFEKCNTDDDTLTAQINTLIDMFNGKTPMTYEGVRAALDKFPDLLGDLSKTPYMIKEFVQGPVSKLTAESTDDEIYAAIDATTKVLSENASDTLPSSIVVERNANGLTYTARPFLEAGELDSVAKVVATNPEDAKRLLSLIYAFNSISKDNPVRQRIGEMIAEHYTHISDQLEKMKTQAASLKGQLFSMQTLSNLNKMSATMAQHNTTSSMDVIMKLFSEGKKKELRDFIQQLTYVANFNRAEGNYKKFQNVEKQIVALRNAIDPATGEISMEAVEKLIQQEDFSATLKLLDKDAAVLKQGADAYSKIGEKIQELRQTLSDTAEDLRKARENMRAYSDKKKSAAYKKAKREVNMLTKKHEAVKKQIDKFIAEPRTGKLFGEYHAYKINEATRSIVRNKESLLQAKSYESLKNRYDELLLNESAKQGKDTPTEALETALSKNEEASALIAEYHAAVEARNDRLLQEYENIAQPYGNAYVRPISDKSVVRSEYQLGTSEASSQVDWIDDELNRAGDVNAALANDYNVRDRLLDSYATSLERNTDEAGELAQRLSAKQAAMKIAKESEGDFDKYMALIKERGLGGAFDDGVSVLSTLPDGTRGVAEKMHARNEIDFDNAQAIMSGTEDDLVNRGISESEAKLVPLIRGIWDIVRSRTGNNMFEDAFVAVKKIRKQLEPQAFTDKRAQLIEMFQSLTMKVDNNEFKGGEATRYVVFDKAANKRFSVKKDIQQIRKEALAGIKTPTKGRSLRQSIQRIFTEDLKDYFSDMNVLSRDTEEDAITEGLTKFFDKFKNTDELEAFFGQVSDAVMAPEAQERLMALVTPIQNAIVESLIKYERRQLNTCNAVYNMFRDCVYNRGSAVESAISKISYTGLNIEGSLNNLENAGNIGEIRWQEILQTLQGKGAGKEDAASYNLTDLLQDTDNQAELLKTMYLYRAYAGDREGFAGALSKLRRGSKVNDQNAQIVQELAKHFTFLENRLKDIGAEEYRLFSPIDNSKVHRAHLFFEPISKDALERALQPIRYTQKLISNSDVISKSGKAEVFSNRLEAIQNMLSTDELSEEQKMFTIKSIEWLDFNQMFNRRKVLDADLNVCADIMSGKKTLTEALGEMGTDDITMADNLNTLIEGMEHITTSLVGNESEAGFIRSQMRRSARRRGAEKQMATYLTDLGNKLEFRSDEAACEAIDILGYDDVQDAFFKGYEKGQKAYNILSNWGGEPVEFMHRFMNEWNTGLGDRKVQEALYGEAARIMATGKVGVAYGDSKHVALNNIVAHNTFSKWDKGKLSTMMGNLTGADETEAGVWGRIIRLISTIPSCCLLAKAGIKSLADYNNIYQFFVNAGFDTSVRGTVTGTDVISSMGNILTHDKQLMQVLGLEMYSVVDDILSGSIVKGVTRKSNPETARYIQAAGGNIEAMSGNITMKHVSQAYKRGINFGGETLLAYIENKAARLQDAMLNGFFKIGPLTLSARTNAQMLICRGLAEETLRGNVTKESFKLLKRAGISEQEWQVASKVCIDDLGKYVKKQGYNTDNYNGFTTFINAKLDQVPDEEFVVAMKEAGYDVTKMKPEEITSFRHNLADKVDILIGSSTAEMTTIPTERSRIWNTLGQPLGRGTVAGEVARAITKYQSYGVAATQTHWARTVYKDIDPTDPAQTAVFPLVADILGSGDPMAREIRQNAMKNSMSYMIRSSITAFVLSQALAIMSGSVKAPQANEDYFSTNIFPPIADSLGVFGVILNAIYDGVSKPMGGSISLGVLPAATVPMKIIRSYGEIAKNKQTGTQKMQSYAAQTGNLIGYLTGLDRSPLTAASWALCFGDYFDMIIKGEAAWRSQYSRKKFDEQRLMWVDDYRPSLFAQDTFFNEQEVY